MNELRTIWIFFVVRWGKYGDFWASSCTKGKWVAPFLASSRRNLDSQKHRKLKRFALLPSPRLESSIVLRIVPRQGG
jgi:hypothetical protein